MTELKWLTANWDIITILLCSHCRVFHEVHFLYPVDNEWVTGLDLYQTISLHRSTQLMEKGFKCSVCTTCRGGEQTVRWRFPNIMTKFEINQMEMILLYFLWWDCKCKAMSMPWALPNASFGTDMKLNTVVFLKNALIHFCRFLQNLKWSERSKHYCTHCIYNFVNCYVRKWPRYECGWSLMCPDLTTSRVYVFGSVHTRQHSGEVTIKEKQEVIY